MQSIVIVMVVDPRCLHVVSGGELKKLNQINSVRPRPLTCINCWGT